MDKRALITGASEGIGRELAKQLSAAGYRITGVARSEDRLKELVAELSGPGHDYLVADLSKTDGLKKVSERIKKEDYSLLVNNAGFGAVGLFNEVPVEKLQEMLRLNVEALTVLSHVFLTKATAESSLINVSSVVGLVPLTTQPVYSASKFYVSALTECLAVQYAEKGVYIMALHPGATESKFFERAGGKAASVPQFLIEKSTDVAATALKQLEARKETLVISGRLNEIFVAASKLVPRKAFRSLMARKKKSDAPPAKAEGTPATSGA